MPRKVPHSHRITSYEADLLIITTPAGIEGMFRETGRDRATPRPLGYTVTPQPAVAAEYGNAVLGPAR